METRSSKRIESPQPEGETSGIVTTERPILQPKDLNVILQAKDLNVEHDKNLDEGFKKQEIPAHNVESDSNVVETTGQATNATEHAATRENLLSKSSDDAYSFLESLGEDIPLDKCHPCAKPYRITYLPLRGKLASVLFALFNEGVFQNRLPVDTELVWNKQFTAAAGRCDWNWTESGRVPDNFRVQIRIQLSSLLLNIPERLRDTLIHEMCHAAVHVIDRSDDGHGAMWKAWTMKAMERFQELPPIVIICNYAVPHRYTYMCKGCKYTIGRHTRSLNTKKRVCGYCKNSFELTN